MYWFTVKRLMPDPSTLTDMDAAAARLADAALRGESVAIFGDYDVDGATSTALLVRVLRAAGLDPFFHIPDRLFEGYGPNVEAVRALAARGAKLLVTVDCGTTSPEALTEAHNLGLDAVVIDHHQTGHALPPAGAVVKPFCKVSTSVRLVLSVDVCAKGGCAASLVAIEL